MNIETIEPIIIAGSILASVVSVTAAFSGRKPRQATGHTVTVTIEDSMGGLVRSVTRSTRRIDQIRRDVERAIRDGC